MLCVEPKICNINIFEKKPRVGGQPIKETINKKTLIFVNHVREDVNNTAAFICLEPRPIHTKNWIKINVISI